MVWRFGGLARRGSKGPGHGLGRLTRGLGGKGVPSKSRVGVALRGSLWKGRAQSEASARPPSCRSSAAPPSPRPAPPAPSAYLELLPLRLAPLPVAPAALVLHAHPELVGLHKVGQEKVDGVPDVAAAAGGETQGLDRKG